MKTFARDPVSKTSQVSWRFLIFREIIRFDILPTSQQKNKTQLYFWVKNKKRIKTSIFNIMTSGRFRLAFLIFFANDLLLVCVKYVKYRMVIIVKYRGSISNLEKVLQNTIAYWIVLKYGDFQTIYLSISSLSSIYQWD